MPISSEQKTDLEQAIMLPIEMIGDEGAQRLVIEYLLRPSKDHEKRLLANLAAKEGLEDLLEQKYLVADLWRTNKIFLGKGDKENPPSALEIATVMLGKLFAVLPSARRDSHPVPEYSFIYQALVKKGVASNGNSSMTNLNDADNVSNSAQAETAYQEENQFIQELLAVVYEGGTDYVKGAIDNGLDINKKYPPYGGTLLSYAVVGGNLEMVNYLLAHHADPNITDLNDNLPLQWAILKLVPENQSTQQNQRSQPIGQLDTTRLPIVNALLEAGSRVDLKDKRDQSPLELWKHITGRLGSSWNRTIGQPGMSEIIGVDEKIARNNEKTFIPLIGQQKEIQAHIHTSFSIVSEQGFKKVVPLLRLCQVPNSLLRTKFTASNGDIHTLLELGILYRDWNFFQQCVQISRDDRGQEGAFLYKASSNGVMSPLTFALEQAFQARYTHKEEYLKFAKYLLQNGAKAGARDLEILESFYPDIPEDILKLTGFATEFEGMNESVSRYDAQQAQRKLLEKTGLNFEIVEIENQFVLQHADKFCQMDVDNRTTKIQEVFGSHKLGVQETSRGMGMGWSQVTLTIPSRVIPQIVQNNFSLLIRQQKKAGQLQQSMATQQEKAREKNRQINAAKMELNLLRTRPKATEVYKEINAIMPNQWQLVPTQEGYELQYSIGFKEEKEKFDESRSLGLIGRLLMTRFSWHGLQERQITTSRGSIMYQLVITPAKVTSSAIQSYDGFWDDQWPSDPNKKPNLYYVLKLIELNPALKDRTLAYNGATPLFLAITEADVDAVKKLIDLGVNVNATNKKRITMLAWTILQSVSSNQLVLQAVPSDKRVPSEKQERYKQIALLLVKAGVKLDTYAEIGIAYSHVTLIHTQQPDWLGEIREARQVAKTTQSQSAHSSTETPTISQEDAQRLLRQYKPSLLEFQRVQEVSPTLPLARADERFVPNILSALAAIAEGKTSFVPEVDSSGMSSLGCLPENPVEVLVKLSGGFVSEATQQPHFCSMIDHYCGETDLGKRLSTFASIFKNGEIVLSVDTSSKALSVGNDDDDELISLKETYLENVIDAWSTLNSAYLNDQNRSKLEKLKTEFSNEIQNLKVDEDAQPEKLEDFARMVTMTENFMSALSASGTKNEEQLKEMAQAFHAEVFTLPQRLWIAFISFVDSVLSVFPRGSDEPTEGSSFRFFKPFEDDKFKQEILEFSRSLEAPTSIEVLRI
jgi:ankyrin repeat protein